MRLFVAVNLPDAERQALAVATAGLRAAGLSVRWARPEGLHLTLKFLGDVPSEAAPAIGEALRGALRDVRPFDVTLGGLGGFPDLARPRVLWVGVERHPALELLAHDVERTLAPFGFASELRPFHPHITIGRAQRESGGLVGGVPADQVAAFDYAGSLMVEAVDLMRSEPGPGGAVYERRERAPLAGRRQDV